MEAAGKGLKSFITVVLVLGLVLGQQQIQVQWKPRPAAHPPRQEIYTSAAVSTATTPRAVCAKASGCKIVHGKCDSPYSSLHSDSDEANALEFCKLGCASSACDSIKKTVGNEEASDAVDRCDEACYRFCTKHVDTAAATTVVSS